jgi:hypothetical protein
MLLPYTTLTYYGPGAVASVMDASSAISASPSGFARMRADVAGLGTIPLARGTRLRSSPAVLAGNGAIDRAAPKANGRIGALIGITGLTQSDVTGAVLEAEVYPGISLKKALRGILSAQGGKVGISGSTVTIRDPADTKNVITATTDAEGRRTAVTLDLD